MDPSRQCCCSIRYCSVVVFVASLPGLHYRRRRRRRRLVQFARPTKRRPPSSRIFYPRAMDFVEWNDRSGPILEFSSFDWGESFYEGEIRLLDK